MFDVLVSAITLSSIYALVALGISLTWSTLGILNLAHGAAFVTAGYGVWLIGVYISTNPIVVILGSILVGAFTGVVLYFLSYLPLADKSNFANRSLIATLALSLFTTQLYLSVFGPRVKPLPKLFPLTKLEFLGERIGIDKIGIILSATILLLLIILFLQRSRAGLQMRAIMQNPEGASLVGIDRKRLALGVLVLSGIMVGLASTLLGQTFFVSPEAGVQPLTKGLITAMLGGLGSVPGAILAALLVGFTEALTVEFFGAQYSLMTQLGLVALMLLVRPRGIAGVLETSRE